MNENQLAKKERGLEVVPEPTIATILQTALDRNQSPEGLGKILDVYERMQKNDAEKQYNAAFVAMQQELPQITATSVIPNRGKYEKFEDVMHVVSPILRKHGFAESFSQESDDKNRITVTCHLMHIGGHSRDTKFTVRSGGKADSETQADCKASTTAKRNALCQALNIVIRQDVLNEEDDATIEGTAISQEQADKLRERVKATGSDESLFLEFAQAERYEDIRTGMLLELDTHLTKKERQQARNKQPVEDLSKLPEQLF